MRYKVGDEVGSDEGVLVGFEEGATVVGDDIWFHHGYLELL